MILASFAITFLSQLFSNDRIEKEKKITFISQDERYDIDKEREKLMIIASKFNG